MSNITLSVVIPARNEFPHVVFTIYSILHAWKSSGFGMKEIELILVDNCSDDNKYPQRGTGGTTSYLEGRGGYFNRIIRIVRDPIAGNHSARNTGAKIARGKYLYFSDAHVALDPFFFKHILETIEKNGGLVFGSLQTMGAYPPTDSSMGFQYTWKLGDECRETWANYKLADTPWYIIGQGAWGMGVKREEFEKYRGYEFYHKTYGGEFYITSKWWMLGSTVMVDPKAIGYHLGAGRGYSYHHLDYVENILNLLYALGADDWRERTYINYLRSKNKADLDRIMVDGARVYEGDRKWIAKHRKYTFNDLLVKRPWEQKNIKLYGKSNCGISIFHWSELDLISQNPIAMEGYRNSKLQKQLHTFITENLSQYIYRPELYPDKERFKEMVE